MIKNYWKVAWRNFKRNKLISSINTIGLTIGISCCILLYHYVMDELSYDKHIPFHEQVYRVAQKQNFDGSTQELATTSGLLATALKSDLPEVELASRVWIRKNLLISFSDKQQYDNNIAYVDSSFISMFGLSSNNGKIDVSKFGPNDILLTSATATKIFGDINPIGKVIAINNNSNYRVSGIIYDPPVNSHMHYDCISLLSSVEATSPWIKDWQISSVWTYIKLKPNTSFNFLTDKLKNLVIKYRGKEALGRVNYFLQPVTSIHLYSHLSSEIETNNDILYVKIFSLIAIVVLLLACLNYIILITASYSKRLKEIGMRKMFGANRKQIIFQFLGESATTCFISFILSLILVSIFLESFNKYTEKHVQFSDLYSVQNISLLFVTLFIVSSITGFFPAFWLSGSKTIYLFKNKLTATKESVFSQALIGFQFLISISLIVVTIVASKQNEYIQEKNLGFDKKHLLNIKVRDRGQWQGHTETLRNEFLKINGVSDASAALNSMGDELEGTDVRLANAPPSETRLLTVTFVDQHYFSTLQLKMAAGRAFSESFPSDTLNAFIINETASKKLGWADPKQAIGKQLEYYGGGRVKEQIIGVVKDFHYASLHEEVQPLILLCWPSKLSSFIVRVESDNIQELINRMKLSWASISPNYPFEYNFVDDRLDRFYKNDKRVGLLLVLFSSMAILIACLGLLGLTLFSIQKRVKEIGIRKAIGATTEDIIVLLCKDMIRPILYTNIIAWPLGWLLANKWLDNFAYHITFNWTILLLASVIILIVSIITVSIQSFKTATSNPIKSLQSD